MEKQQKNALVRLASEGKKEDLYELVMDDVLKPDYLTDVEKKELFKAVALYDEKDGNCTKMELIKFLVDANLHEEKLLELVVLEGFRNEDIKIIEYLLSVGVSVTDRTYRAVVCRRLISVLEVFLSYGIVPPQEAIGIAEKADFADILEMFAKEDFYSKEEFEF